MNGALLLAFAGVWFLIAYFVLGKRIERLFGVDSSRRTPAYELEDGQDYQPTHPAVVFGHHFAAIAGAGPIVGPVLALQYGWVPVVIWILVGCALVGSFHDFAAMFLSIRNQGKSIGVVVERQIGFSGRMIFSLFCFAALILIVAVFVSFVVEAFMQTPSVATATVLFLTMSPIFGWCTTKKGMSLRMASLIFVPLLFLSVYIGVCFPLELTKTFQLGALTLTPKLQWTLILLLCSSITSVLPVWVMMQPRDYLNAYLLYAMIAVGFLGAFVAAPTIAMPAVTQGVPLPKALASVFPFLFVTVACGACSGFHALVSSGTSVKQISNEKHVRVVAYGCMLVEGLLAVLAVVAVGRLSPDAYALIRNNPIDGFAAGIASFAIKLGLPENIGISFISLAISAFILTTLDAAVRLARFLWTEMVGTLPAPAVRKSLGNSVTATAMVILISGGLCITNAGSVIWPIFGATNQLLAALTLLVAAAWLYNERKRFVPTLLAMLFMLTMSVWALVLKLLETWGKSWPLAGASLFLLCVSAILCTQSCKLFFKERA